MCEQSSAPKVKITEKNLRTCNKMGFGNSIGSITNRATSLFDVMAGLEVGSPEYKEASERIIKFQMLQQNEIDKIKGISAKKTPKEWYDYKSNKINVDKETGEILDDEETLARKEFNLKIMANKKPYFFIYNYPNLMSEYKSLKVKANETAIVEYGMRFDDLKIKENKTDEEKRFVNYIEKSIPVFDNPCTMNRICHRVEDIFSDIKNKTKDNSKFDYNIYKSKKKYTKELFDKVSVAIKKYKKDISNANKIFIANNITGSDARSMIRDQFMVDIVDICPNEEVFTNIVLDITYGKNANKELAWSLCGEQIIKNLLYRNNNTIKHLVIDNDYGDIEWNGNKFREIEVSVEG